MITLQERVHGVKPPKEWPLNKLHHIFMVRKGNKNVGMLNNNLLSLSYGRIIKKNINTSEGLLPESFETYQIVEPGDIVMRLTDLQNDKRSLRQGLVKEKGIITSAYDAIFPANGHDSRYWAYALLAIDLAKYYYSLGGGVRQSIKFKDFPNDWIYTPPTKTQKEIADFLDRETDRIDQLIEKKKQLIYLLNEKRNSLVYEKVNTVNQNVLRFSRKKFPSKFITDNFPQTKELPFEVVRLGLVTRIFSGGTPDKSNLSFWLNGHIPWIGSGEVNQFKVTKPTAYITSDAVANSSTKLMPKGSIIMALAGQGKTKAMVAQMGIDAYGNQSLACIDGYNGNNRFLLWWLKSLYLQIRALSSQETRDGLNQSILGQLPTPILNKQIQISIADFLDKENEKIDQLIKQISASIELLRLFKSSLITEAVTGQLDIKAWEKRGRTDERLDNIEESMRT
ncbi:TPA: restriction endonuclease subunit S [Legionella pneumophila]|nr:restriction endonuclease subunit S [Legionella pneumophila]